MCRKKNGHKSTAVVLAQDCLESIGGKTAAEIQPVLVLFQQQTMTAPVELKLVSNETVESMSGDRIACVRFFCKIQQMECRLERMEKKHLLHYALYCKLRKNMTDVRKPTWF